VLEVEEQEVLLQMLLVVLLLHLLALEVMV
jgi:hypothetical protein